MGIEGAPTCAFTGYACAALLLLELLLLLLLL